MLLQASFFCRPGLQSDRATPLADKRGLVKTGGLTRCGIDLKNDKPQAIAFYAAKLVTGVQRQKEAKPNLQILIALSLCMVRIELCADERMGVILNTPDLIGARTAQIRRDVRQRGNIPADSLEVAAALLEFNSLSLVWITNKRVDKFHIIRVAHIDPRSDDLITRRQLRGN